MKEQQRRDFLRLLGASSAMTLGTIFPRPRTVQARQSTKAIKCGQIGTRHAHASGKMVTMRKFSKDYQVVGVVEPDAERRKTLEKSAAYQGVTWMSEDQL